MNQKELNEVLVTHRRWLENSSKGECANLSDKNLAGLNLSRANLCNAILGRTNLTDANMSHALLVNAELTAARLHRVNLTGACLFGAQLNYAKATEANCQNADFSLAQLTKADFTYANFKYADLSGANLYLSRLIQANLAHAFLPSPTMVLLANWQGLSDQLTADLMLFCADCHQDPTAFDRWAITGDCPYANSNVERSAYFDERPHLWGRGRPCKPHQLMKRVLEECGCWPTQPE